MRLIRNPPGLPTSAGAGYCLESSSHRSLTVSYLGNQYRRIPDPASMWDSRCMLLHSTCYCVSTSRKPRFQDIPRRTRLKSIAALGYTNQVHTERMDPTEPTHIRFLESFFDLASPAPCGVGETCLEVPRHFFLPQLLADCWAVFLGTEQDTHAKYADYLANNSEQCDVLHY